MVVASTSDEQTRDVYMVVASTSDKQTRDVYMGCGQ